jgi:uncharacterized protein
MKIIYLHGLASVGLGPKTQALAYAFGDRNVIYPDLPLSPNKTIKLVDDIVKGRDDRFIFVGTSMGGFWANYFAHKYACSRAVLINPLTNPVESFMDRRGTIVKNYVTAEETLFTQEIMDEFSVAENVLLSKFNPKLIDVFLAKDDDVIDYQHTLKALNGARSTTVLGTGGHRFEEPWPKVIKFIRKLVDD